MTGEHITVTSAVKGEVDLSAVQEAHPDYHIKYDGRQVELTPTTHETSKVRKWREARAMGNRALKEAKK